MDHPTNNNCYVPDLMRAKPHLSICHEHRGRAGVRRRVFRATNIDVALVLVVYFAAAAKSTDGFGRCHVWTGQLLGFLIIVVVSLVGAFAGSFLPTKYSGLLGFVPLCIGLWRTRHWCIKDKTDEKESSEAYVQVEINAQTSPKAGARVSESSQQLAAVEDAQSSCTTPEKKSRLKRALHVVCSSHTLKMATVTIANGGDNVAIYIPLMVTYNAGEVVVTIAVFYIMLVLWIFLAGAFVSFRVVANTIERYGKFIVPVALILLGLYILYSADVLSLVCSSCSSWNGKMNRFLPQI